MWRSGLGGTILRFFFFHSRFQLMLVLTGRSGCNWGLLCVGAIRLDVCQYAPTSLFLGMIKCYLFGSGWEEAGLNSTLERPSHIMFCVLWIKPLLFLILNGIVLLQIQLVWHLGWEGLNPPLLKEQMTAVAGVGWGLCWNTFGVIVTSFLGLGIQSSGHSYLQQLLCGLLQYTRLGCHLEAAADPEQWCGQRCYLWNTWAIAS